MRKLFLSLALSALLPLVAAGCGGGSDKNPILGEWELDIPASAPELGKMYGSLDKISEMLMEFQEGSIAISVNGQKLEERKIIYVQNPDKTWKTCAPDGTQCDKIEFADKNTILLPIMDNVVITLRRK